MSIRNRSIQATWAGASYLVTHVTSVGALLLYGGTVQDATSTLNGRQTVLAGGLFEVLLAAGVVGTAVALYPLLRDRGPGLSIAYVALRTLEASVILTGVVTLLPVVASPASTGVPGLGSDATLALRLIHEWTFLVGPGLIAPINTVVLAWLLWRERLVPRFIPLLGLGGAVLVGVANLAVLFGLTRPVAWAAIPIFVWEISLAFRLLGWGVGKAAER